MDASELLPVGTRLILSTGMGPKDRLFAYVVKEHVKVSRNWAQMYDNEGCSYGEALTCVPFTEDEIKMIVGVQGEDVLRSRYVSGGCIWEAETYFKDGVEWSRSTWRKP